MHTGLSCHRNSVTLIPHPTFEWAVSMQSPVPMGFTLTPHLSGPSAYEAPCPQKWVSPSPQSLGGWPAFPHTQ